MARTDFLNHRPDSAGLDKIEQLKDAAIKFDELIDALSPECLEKVEAKKRLREASMWAVASVVMDYPAIELGERYEDQKNV